jgi:putative flippase GtrA
VAARLTRGEAWAQDEKDGRPVTTVRALYERFRQIIHEFAKFGVIGVIGLLITNIGYAVLHSNFGVGPVSATTIATIIATCVTYVGNRYWSFRHRERTNVAREGLIFFVLNGIGLGIQDLVVAFNYYILHYRNKPAEFLALNAGIAIATLFRFWSYRRFVWAEKAGEDGVTATAGGPGSPDEPMAGRRDGGFPPLKTDPDSIEHANGHDVGARPSGDSFSRR